MLHRSAPNRQPPDEKTKAKLASVGLGDPTAALRREAKRDLLGICATFVIAFIVASTFDIGEWYREASVKYENWEFDEIAMATTMSIVAFCWYAARQWRRYRDEVARRLKLVESLVAMRVVADQLGENKAHFLANIAHDFRTPLNGILGFAQLINEEPFGPLGDDRYKKYVQTIQESAEMLNERIETCLDPEKFEFGAEPMQMMPYPLKNAINGAMPMLQELADSARIALLDDVSNDLPDVHGDGRALRKIIVNLVTNAIKHSRPKCSVRLSAERMADNDLTLVVEDDGIGMDPKLVAALQRGWQPTQAATEDTGESASTGLFVTKKLLDLHGASLHIDTSAAQGTRVTVTFPQERLILKAS